VTEHKYRIVEKITTASSPVKLQARRVGLSQLLCIQTQFFQNTILIRKEVLNAKGNGNGKRGKGRKPTGETTCGDEPRTTTHHHTCLNPCRKNPPPLSPTPNIGTLE
jgi:hypothetical protein